MKPQLAIQLCPNQPKKFGKTPLLNPVASISLKFKGTLISHQQRPKKTNFIEIPVCGESIFFYHQPKFEFTAKPPAPWCVNIHLNQGADHLLLCSQSDRNAFENKIIYAKVNEIILGKETGVHDALETSEQQRIDENILFVLLHPKLSALIPLKQEEKNQWVQIRNDILFDRKSREIPSTNDLPAFARKAYELLDLILSNRGPFKKNSDNLDALKKIEIPPYLVLAYFYLNDMAQIVSGSRSEQKRQLNQLLERVRDQLKDVLNPKYLSLLSSPLNYELAQAAYFDGEFHKAIEYLNQVPSEKDVFFDLNRLKAKICTDIGLLKHASSFGDKAYKDAQSQGKEDRYKSLGRLGEIYIRQNQLTKAYDTYNEQITILERLEKSNELNRSEVYLAHTAQLLNKLEEAQDYYQEAKPRNFKEEHAIYWLMGVATLALRTQDFHTLLEDVDGLFAIIEQHLENPIHSMPAAITLFALSQGIHHHQDKMRQATPEETFKRIDAFIQPLKPKAIEKLIQSNYLYESLYLMSLEEIKTPDAYAVKQIQKRLSKWQQAIHKSKSTWLDSAKLAEEKISPEKVNALIKQAKKSSNWTPLEEVWPFVYPCNLIPR